MSWEHIRGHDAAVRFFLAASIERVSRQRVWNRSRRSLPFGVHGDPWVEERFRPDSDYTARGGL